MLLIDSVYVNNSGGLVLLEYLLKSLKSLDEDIFYLLDNRSSRLAVNLKTSYELTSGEKGRKQFYLKNKGKFDRVLCFGNVPPPVKISIPVFIYFHNLLILQPSYSASFKKSVLMWLKKEFIRQRLRKGHTLIVQTSHGYNLVKKVYGNKKQVKIFPVFDVDFCKKAFESERLYNQKFLYVSNGNSHKNHKLLLEAWQHIQSSFPDAALYLTVSADYPLLKQQIKDLKLRGFNIYNLGIISQQELNKFYRDCCFCLYPSLIESFGLGLIEAATAGQKIIASDLPFVHSVVKPSFVFNPNQTSSLVSAIKSALRKKNIPETELLVKDEMSNMLNFIFTKT